MRGMFGWLGAFLVGALGWWLGRFMGMGAALITGCIGAGIGLYHGRKLFEKWLG